MKHFLRNTALTSVLDLVDALGANRHDLLSRISLSPELAHRNGALIETGKMMDALACAAILTGQKNFGLDWGARNARSALGPLSIFVENCASAREAVTEVGKYMRLHNSALNYSIIQGRARDRLRFDCLAHGKYPDHQFVEACLAAFMHFWRAMLGPGWTPEEVWFQHERLSSRAEYHKIFGGSVLFGQAMTCMVAPKTDFDARLTPRDTRVKEFVQGILQEIDRVHSDDLPGKIRVILQGVMPQGRATSTEVSTRLSIPERTMQRRLSGLGTSFKEIVTDERLRIATDYVLQDRLSVTALAPVLGFSEASSVSRFLREHGDELKRRTAMMTARET